jgi:hypothetical protein
LANHIAPTQARTTAFARPAWLRGRAAARALVAQKGRAVVTAADRLHEITSFDRSLHDRRRDGCCDDW